MGIIVSINISAVKGVVKDSVEKANVLENWGLKIKKGAVTKPLKILLNRIYSLSCNVVVEDGCRGRI